MEISPPQNRPKAPSENGAASQDRHDPNERTSWICIEHKGYLAHYSVNTTDCTVVISNRLRQRMFLQAIMSSFRSM